MKRSSAVYRNIRIQESVQICVIHPLHTTVVREQIAERAVDTVGPTAARTSLADWENRTSVNDAAGTT